MSKIVKLLFVGILLCNCALGYADNYSQQALYQNYLSGKMDLWGRYLSETDNHKSFTTSELSKILNYEYGYIAWCLGEKRTDEAKHRLAQFDKRIELLAQTGYNPSTIHVYRASVAAYSINFNKLKMLSLARTAMQQIDSALLASPQNSLAITLKGNADFYRPAAVGGDKKNALRLFLKSEQIMREQGLTTNNWNYRALQLCIAQCYDKLGQTAQAIAYCQQVLAEEPNFAYMRDVLLPELLAHKK